MPKEVEIFLNLQSELQINSLDEARSLIKSTRQERIEINKTKEEIVDDKYYLKEKGIGRLIKMNNKLIRNNDNPEVSSCIIAGYHKMDGRNNQYISEQNKPKRIGGIYDTAERKMFNPYNEKEIKDIAPTQTANCGCSTSSAAVLISEDGKNYLKIRKLTPLECWRLMGFDDIDFFRAKKAEISDTQLYRQAGNSIVVNVLQNIFGNLSKVIG